MTHICSHKRHQKSHCPLWHGYELFIASPWQPQTCSYTSYTISNWNQYCYTTSCFIFYHFTPLTRKPDSVCNRTWQYRIVHSKLFTIYLMEVSCCRFLSKTISMLFHPDLFQVKQADLSVRERWKEKNLGRRGEMRRREGCSGTEYLFYFGKFLDCYSTLLTLPCRLNTLECGWHILACETNGTDSDYRHKWPSNGVRDGVKLNCTICLNCITSFGLKIGQKFSKEGN